MKPPFIAGAGAWGRGDDEAGLLAVRELHSLGIAAVELHDFTALPDLLDGVEAAILVDAVLGPWPPGRILEFHGIDDLPGQWPLSTHGYGLLSGLRLTRQLRRLPPRLRLYGITAARFAFGHAASPPVASAARRTARRILLQLSPA
jgi:hydrogenase maturation protease